MKWYHGTNRKAWELIKKEGILFGVDRFKHGAPRKTYLATDIEEAKCYGDVLLEVEYNPSIHPTMNNYVPDCWQVRVYEPIPISKIQEVKLKTKEAPEKIYLDSYGSGFSHGFHTNKLYNNDIEYTRTDAFIEKACKWLKSKGGFTIGFDGATVRDFLEFINK